MRNSSHTAVSQDTERTQPSAIIKTARRGEVVENYENKIEKLNRLWISVKRSLS